MAKLARDFVPRCREPARHRLLAWCGPPAALVIACCVASCGENDPELAADDDQVLDAGARKDGAVQGDAGGSRTDASQDARAGADDMSCVRGQYTAEARSLDIFILLDQSGSMQEDEDRWTPTTNALTTFVGLPDLARTSVAMQYFPLGSSDDEKCEPDRYAAPDVAMAELPANTDPVRASIDAHYFTHEECCDTDEHSGTPTRPAIEGAAAYMREWLSQRPDHVGVILLATDGEPSDVCDNNDVEDVAAAIAEAASTSPPVRTYVIGIGDNDALDELAAAGGTGADALIVDGSGANTEQQFLEAVSRIRKAALPCDYPLGQAPDPTSLNVEWSAGGAGTVQLVNVRSDGECDKAESDGWYYDDPERPTRVNLCPETCEAVAKASGAVVRIVEGCETTVLL